ncbi:MAG: LysR family transcriptional regulator [Gammaproteobacteria bacterium]|nr:LysR family transcriptional regulator [Gammaproteobacteria bacterium]
MDIDYLQALPIFVGVARYQSFSVAADELGLSTATVSRHIARLERRVGAQLFVRTTRNVALTEIGERFYQRSNALLATAAESLAEINDLQIEPRGTLRVTAPTMFGIKHLGALVSRFTECYPQVEVRMTISDDLENIGSGGFDIAVRITNHLDDGVIAKRLSPVNWVVCASPAYLQKFGTPQTPLDLRSHECCHYASLTKDERWNFTRGEMEQSVPVRSRFHVNSSHIISEHALSGRSVALLPTYLVGEYIQSGALVPLLTAFRPAINSSLYAIYSPTRYLTAKAKRFLDFLVEAFGDPPYWESAEPFGAFRTRPSVTGRAEAPVPTTAQ